MASVDYAIEQCKDTDEVTDLSTKDFVTDLESYSESGIFSDSIDFTYQTNEKEHNIVLYIGRLSTYCNVSVIAKLQLSADVTMTDVEEELRKTVFDEVAEQVSA
ncbi:MAG: hypothetical protein LUE99_03570 [Bacteroides sp.]|nr:hypothetical protein [Bacteroides sp.]